MRRLQRGMQLFLLCTVCLLSSCAFLFQPLEEQSAVEAIPEAPTSLALTKRLQAREKQAKDFMQQGDLAAALGQWEILQALAPHKPEYQQQITQLRSLIAKKVQQHFQQGEQAVERGNVSQARREFLAVLALDPYHQHAQGQLRVLESQWLKAQSRLKIKRTLAKE